MATKNKQINDPSQKSDSTVLVSEGIPELKIRPKRMTKRQRLEGVLVEVFHAHWQAVSEKIEAGEKIAPTRSSLIFACNNRQRERYARQYYAPARAAKFASIPADEVLRLTSIWLDAYYEYIDGWPVTPREIRDELCQLVAVEYVGISLSKNTSSPLGDLPMVCPLPNEKVCGDVYEITASGLSIGANLRICKSVAEPFTEAERREAMVGIERDFFVSVRNDEEDEDEWRIDFLDDILKPIDPCFIEMNVVSQG